MRTSTDLQQTILQHASELFAQQGYAATTNKQIAQAAGCTTAALYYYFEGGKPQILRDVVRSYSRSLTHVFETTANTASLQGFVVRLGHTLSYVAPDVLRRMSWILVDFPKLQPEEQRLLHELLTTIHANIVNEVGRFVADQQAARHAGWLIFCAFFGYEQIFLTLDVKRVDPLDYETYAETLAQLFADS